MLFERKIKPPTPNDIKDVGEEKDAIFAMQGARDAFELPLPLTDKCQQPTEKEESENNGDNVDFGQVIDKMSSLSDDVSATQVISDLTRSGLQKDDEENDKDLAMKADIFHAGSFTAGQWFAKFNLELGDEETARALLEVCDWQYIHNSALKGRGKLNRTEQALAALKEEIAKEFQLKKEVKAIMP